MGVGFFKTLGWDWDGMESTFCERGRFVFKKKQKKTFTLDWARLVYFFGNGCRSQYSLRCQPLVN